MTETTRTARETEILSLDPRTGTVNGPVAVSTAADVDEAIAAAHAAAPEVAATSPADRARWLDAVGDALDAAGPDIIRIGASETGLAEDRLTSELATAVRQWRFYALAAREGSWLGATIDHATGIAPDLRRVGLSVGVVAVFGASNFPLTYGMLGHDTATALASGSPVVVKAHPAHPRLGVFLSALVDDALAHAGAPTGTLRVVSGFDAGRRLVLDPRVGAVAFTGSQAGGMALLDLARSRPVPIPVYAEMGTVNPVIVTAAHAEAEMTELADGFVRAVRFGGGQVCTKPGLVFVPRGKGFTDAVADSVRGQAPAGWALTEGIAATYRAGIARYLAAGAELIARTPAHGEGWAFEAAMLSVPIESLLPESEFVEECFGPVGIVVEYDDADQVIDALGRMQGALTASIFATGDDDPQLARLVTTLAGKVGRVVVGQWPSGVATTWAQHHGGPWPATSDPFATSVGMAALGRFRRPVTFQNIPDRLLPASLQNANPWGIPRRIDGAPALRDRLETPGKANE